ncbi:MAG: winged helix-turn-helix domain-containing tetratricopeptide repeat protein [Terriglobales bacterium]
MAIFLAGPLGSKTPKREIEIDLGRYELRRSGHRVKLERKPMELLILLAHRHGQLVAREEIEAKLWGQHPTIDCERSINNSVRKIRTALGDDPSRPSLLETVFGKGYRFIGTVRIIPASDAVAAYGLNGAVDPHAASHRQHSSLVVLPFIFFGAGQQPGLSLGFADALISTLGNLEGFFVLPTSSVIKYAGDTNPATVALRFGVHFVLQGTIQVQDSVSRVSVQVFDAESQSVAFAQKYDIDLDRALEVQDDIAQRVASALNRRFREKGLKTRDRYSKDPLAYAEFMRGYGGSSAEDPHMLDESEKHLSRAVARDPKFALAHAMLAYVCANKHFEFDPSRLWLEKAEFHAQKALELDAQLAEAHLAHAYILWGPSKNFQHLQAIAELRRALALQPNLPHAHNRLANILAHIGLLEQARTMYEQGRRFEPRGAMSHGITQVYLCNGEYDSARRQIELWCTENPASKYPLWYAPQPALYEGDWTEGRALLERATRIIPEEPLVISLRGVWHALTGEDERALKCARKACESPKSFGHNHHTYYQIACTHAILGRSSASMEWLERTVDTGFPCWKLFRNDPWLRNLRGVREFELLMNSLQAKYGNITID